MARSIKKGPFIDGHLQKKIEDAQAQSSKKVIKTWSRRSTIAPGSGGPHFRGPQRAKIRASVRQRKHGRSQARRVRADADLPRSRRRQEGQGRHAHRRQARASASHGRRKALSRGSAVRANVRRGSRVASHSAFVGLFYLWSPRLARTGTAFGVAVRASADRRSLRRRGADLCRAPLVAGSVVTRFGGAVGKRRPADATRLGDSEIALRFLDHRLLEAGLGFARHERVVRLPGTSFGRPCG